MMVTMIIVVLVKTKTVMTFLTASDNNHLGLKRILLGTIVLTDRPESNQIEERIK